VSATGRSEEGQRLHDAASPLPGAVALAPVSLLHAHQQSVCRQANAPGWDRVGLGTRAASRASGMRASTRSAAMTPSGASASPASLPVQVAQQPWRPLRQASRSGPSARRAARRHSPPPRASGDQPARPLGSAAFRRTARRPRDFASGVRASSRLSAGSGRRRPASPAASHLGRQEASLSARVGQLAAAGSPACARRRRRCAPAHAGDRACFRYRIPVHLRR